MIAVVEIFDSGTEDGWCWCVSWGVRHDSGRCATRSMCHEAVKQALDREQQSREIHAYYDAHSHTNSGD